MVGSGFALFECAFPDLFGLLLALGLEMLQDYSTWVGQNSWSKKSHKNCNKNKNQGQEESML